MAAVSRRTFARSLVASMAGGSYLGNSMESAPGRQLGRSPSLTDVDGILVGHCTLPGRPTGCTVITSRTPFVAGVDVRGGAPGTRETDLLRPENTVENVNAVLISGGSAFGLDAAGGVVKFLEEKGVGVEVRGIRVPIVCAAILFDLSLGDSKIRPDAKAGYEAAKGASDAAVLEGNVGAGAGCTVGKMLGLEHAMKAGLGSWAANRADGLRVGALVAVNCVGDVVDPAQKRIMAGARGSEGNSFLDTMEQIRRGHGAPPLFRDNTVLGVVATNAALSKAQCSKVAQMAHDALARCIYPSHTPWDGDTVFAIATGRWSSDQTADVGVIGALAADVLSTAILRGVQKAESWGPYPSCRSLRTCR